MSNPVPSTPATPEPCEALYKSILDAARNEQGRHSIRSIKTACDTLARHHSPINANTVGKECLIQSQGPTPASIRNNKDYMTYIKARATAAGLPKPTDGTAFEPVVSDPTTVAYIQSLKDKIILAELQARLLRKYLETQVSSVSIEKFLATQDPQHFGHLMPKEEKPILPAVAAVPALPAELSDPKHLEKFGLELVKERIIHKQTGEVLVKLSPTYEYFPNLLRQSTRTIKCSW
jgi:hypothetical protein